MFMKVSIETETLLGKFQDYGDVLVIFHILFLVTNAFWLVNIIVKYLLSALSSVGPYCFKLRS